MTRRLEIEWEDPRPQARQATNMSGLEYLQAMLDGRIPPPPISKLMGFYLAEVEAGRSVFEVIPGEQHFNPIGTVHGGLAATLLDSALGCAIHTTLPAGVGYTTLQLNINLTRAIMPEVGLLRCEGRIIHSGSRVATAEADITDRDGKIYAHGTTTCLVFSPGT